MALVDPDGNAIFVSTLEVSLVRPAFMVPLGLFLTASVSVALLMSVRMATPAPEVAPSTVVLVPVAVPSLPAVPQVVAVPPVPEVPPVPVIPEVEPIATPRARVHGVIQDCARSAGYQVHTFENPAIEGLPELWLTSVYETHSEHGGKRHPMGNAEVHVVAPGEHILALSSYEPVTWNLSIGPDSTVREVLLWGYHEQLVAGAGDIPVRHVAGPSCGYRWPYTGGGCDTGALVAAVEAAAGQPIQHFAGCYRASDFVIQH